VSYLERKHPEIYQYLEINSRKSKKTSKKILSDLMEDFTNLIKEAPVDAFNNTENLLEYFLEKNFFYFHKIADLIFNVGIENINDMINKCNKIYKEKTLKEDKFFFQKIIYQLFEEFINYHQNDNSINKSQIDGRITSNQIISEEQNYQLNICAEEQDINKSNYINKLPELTAEDVIYSLKQIESEEQNYELNIEPNNTCHNSSQKRKLDDEDDKSNNKKNKNDQEFYINQSEIDKTLLLLNEIISGQETEKNKLHLKDR
jgi:hypothetical protein